MTAVSDIDQLNPEFDLSGEALERLQRVLEKGTRAHWWRRRGDKEHGFWYEDRRGQRVSNERELDRIARLAIPPGYLDVRVAPSSKNRLQAIAIDTAGRVQYRYSANYSECQSRRKYQKIEEFGRLLPKLRDATNRDIARDDLGKDRVVAVMLRLINETYFRLGTEGSAHRYKTFGITSLRNYHLAILSDDHLLFQFTGKHHVRQRRILVDEELASVLREIREIPGTHLFNYLDAEGDPHPVGPADINHYIKSAMGAQFSAKDFRTWGGTLRAAIALAERGSAETERQAKKNIVYATKLVAEQLGNTPTVCRTCYIHPIVFERYQQGVTLNDFRPAASRIVRRQHPLYDLEELELLKLFDTQPACP